MQTYDLQIQRFNEYVDEFKDRLLILIGTDDIIFEPTGVMIDHKFHVVNDGRSALPRYGVNCMIESPRDFETWNRIAKHNKEISRMITNYTILHSHTVGFESKIFDIDSATGDMYELVKSMRAMIDENNIDGQQFHICETDENIIELRVSYYGTERKSNVNMDYVIKSKTDGETIWVPYGVDKSIMLGDIAYQVANKIPTHLR